ncbi:methyltransferase domain-containing protein [Comamonas sp. NyZ500]|uniref:class I SAM-dependent methyltransferase n=1 Tax=Comamonas sp. NyZ500 TaxID=2795732 RepID=UPI00192BB07A|nr:methyltransferase domain-containing protein [Comamonas sp. NyZ500]MBL5978644.1 methyltransferase domain-containing protein [Comamonas sp. NyZ500]
MSHVLPPTIDSAAANHWQMAAPAESPWLHEEVASRMQQRLDWIVKPPETWCHWEPVRGGMQAHQLLRERYPQAECTIYEPVARREAVAQDKLGSRWWQLSRWKGAAVQMGAPADASMDMLWANMLLHTAADPQTLIERWHKALKVDGYVMFSCLGPDTVQQLHRLYAELGWGPAGHTFTDMHDWGDMLVHSGFAEPVMDMERITLTFATPQRLLQELRELGRNLHPGRFAGLRGRGWKAGLLQKMAERWADKQPDGQLSLTFEIVYGHAYKPQPKLRLEANSAVSLEDMKAMLKQPRNTGLR